MGETESVVCAFFCCPVCVCVEICDNIWRNVWLSILNGVHAGNINKWNRHKANKVFRNIRYNAMESRPSALNKAFNYSRYLCGASPIRRLRRLSMMSPPGACAFAIVFGNRICLTGISWMATTFGGDERRQFAHSISRSNSYRIR